MRQSTRYLVALGLGFVVYRISVELMGLLTAVLVGLVAAGCTWALTRRP